MVPHIKHFFNQKRLYSLEHGLYWVAFGSPSPPPNIIVYKESLIRHLGNTTQWYSMLINAQNKYLDNLVTCQQ